MILCCAAHCTYSTLYCTASRLADADGKKCAWPGSHGRRHFWFARSPFFPPSTPSNDILRLRHGAWDSLLYMPCVCVRACVCALARALLPPPSSNMFAPFAPVGDQRATRIARPLTSRVPEPIFETRGGWSLFLFLLVYNRVVLQYLIHI